MVMQVHDPTHNFLKIRSPKPDSHFPFVPVPITGTGPRTADNEMAPVDSPTKPRPGNHKQGAGGVNDIGRPFWENLDFFRVVSSSTVDMVNHFGLHLLNSTPMNGKTVGFAAFDIYQCMSMVGAVTSGEVSEAFYKTLQFGPGITFLNKNGFMKIIYDYFRETNSNNSGQEIKTLRSIGHSGLTINESWVKGIERILGASTVDLNEEDINSWATNVTGGRITQTVEHANTDNNNRLLLGSHLFFKASWKHPFTKHSKQRFYTFKNEFTLCAMMSRDIDTEYFEDELAQMCILPYDKRGSKVPDWHAAVILPKESGPEALSNIVSQLSNRPSALRSVMSSKQICQRRIALTLPRFELNITLDLRDRLQNMGLSPAFQPSADFHPLSSNEPLCITNVMHNLTIQVNDERTETAAATNMGKSGRKSGGKSGGKSCVAPITMMVNRPFLFFIFDKFTTLVLCSAVVTEIGGQAIQT